MEMLRKIWTPVLKLISSVWLCSGLIVMTWSLGCIYFVLGSWRKTAFAAFSVCGKLPVTALPSSLNCFWASYTKNTFSLVWSGWSCGFFAPWQLMSNGPFFPAGAGVQDAALAAAAASLSSPIPFPSNFLPTTPPDAWLRPSLDDDALLHGPSHGSESHSCGFLPFSPSPFRWDILSVSLYHSSWLGPVSGKLFSDLRLWELVFQILECEDCVTVLKVLQVPRCSVSSGLVFQVVSGHGGGWPVEVVLALFPCCASSVSPQPRLLILSGWLQ